MKKRGFTLLELQVAVVILAFGIVTLASLMATQTRLHKKLQTGFRPGTVVYVTKSADPWVRALDLPARITTEPLTQTTPTPISNPANAVTIVSQENDLKAETITVTADLTPIP